MSLIIGFVFDRILGAPRLALSINLAWRSALQAPARSVLTILGVVIGVASVVLIAGLGDGARHAVANQIQAMGPDMIMVSSSHEAAGPRLRARHAADMRQRLPGAVRTAPQILVRVTAIGPVRAFDTRAIGVTSDYFNLGAARTVSGRLITRQDETGRERYAVLGSEAAERLFGSGGVAVGRQIQVNRVPFTVIGVLEPRGAGLFGEIDATIFVPLPTAAERLRGVRPGAPDQVDVISIQFDSSQSLRAGRGAVTGYLRQTLRVREGEADPFSLVSTEEFAEQTQALIGIVQAALAAVAAVSLVVGAVGVANIVLVSVGERTREIGLRSALGATPSDILRQFLAESVLLCTAGGLIGLASGYAIVWAAGALLGWSAGVSPLYVAAALIGGAGTGVIAGVAPALRAAALNPVDALRAL
ncbi:FtsX-like permease family protein [Alkalicaulis satelles]|uniref:FtsX-like permease family protein n=1 Tax=Alkalicaulis satelles TaxID=2609175 RepID=A0A5M6ZM33_9PROT|nr:ABC transporter permease [Alkalicaulis satelles]KAA5803311.1 FtsX-like permease family protein [Alkalicaulis satelles]